jgi:hypothetical protein
LGPPENFNPADQVLNKFENEVQRYEQEIKFIATIEMGHLQKYITNEVRKST